MNLIGKVISNRYEILEEIGIGGMAYVYKAKCNLLNRFVAIKVLKEEYSKDDMFVRRFKTEAQSAASLTHPNIVSVYDVGQDGDIKYIVMELLEGKTLKEYIKENKRLSNEETIDIIGNITLGLEAAHNQKIIHRDIKPQNIVLTLNGTAKITDFGIAKMSSEATITNMGSSTMGSVHYFSPEHAKGGFTDERSDIYSLGIVMYEMVTGKVPFDSDNSVSVAMKHINETAIEPKNLNETISDGLNDIILKCISKNAVDRYKTATMLLKDLRNLLDGKYINNESDNFTKVIPVIKDDVIPNLRTRQPRRVKTYSDKKQSKSKVINTDDRKLIDKKRVYIIAAISAIVIFTIMLIIFSVNMLNKVNDTEVKVYSYTIPNLVGRNYEEVKLEYKTQGLDIVQEKVEYHENIVEGSVISQSQEKGIQSNDSKIYVVVSKGQRLVEVPDVTDKDIKVVRYELEDSLGFNLEIEEVTDDKILEGIVISQEPSKDTEALYGSVIKLKVSKGDGKVRVIMPNVLGKTLDEAKTELEELKLTVKYTYDSDNEEDNGVVLTQSYPQNKELIEGDLVELTVNRLVKSKTFTKDLTEYLEFSEDKTSFDISVIASVDDGPENTVHTSTITVNEEENYSIEFNINGYSKVSYKILVDGEQVEANEESL